MYASSLDLSSQSDCLFEVSPQMCHIDLKLNMIKSEFLISPPNPIPCQYSPPTQLMVPVSYWLRPHTLDPGHLSFSYSSYPIHWQIFHQYLQNTYLTWSFLTNSMAITLTQDISYLDDLFSNLLKWFSKFCPIPFYLFSTHWDIPYK